MTTGIQRHPTNPILTASDMVRFGTTLRAAPVMFLCAAVCGHAQFRDIPLHSTITDVQPMTGIVLWTDNGERASDAIQLEYSYMLYNSVVPSQSTYNWTTVDNLLDAVAGRGHQAVLRFRFVYPGYQTSVPDYIKDLSDYNETVGQSEGRTTSFPDWTHAELQRFTLEFYERFAERYDADPRLAFIQTGFGLWAEYHIYDGPFVLGETFPSKTFQTAFFRHLDTVFTETPWSISIDAADDTYSPFSQNQSLLDIHFGLFDDSFMHEEHWDYNADCWAFFGANRHLHSPGGGEFSYYTDYDQQHVLDVDGMYGVTFEEAASDFQITYMIGNDQPDYQTMARIRDAGMACGYRFTISSFRASSDSSIVEVRNDGVAPMYYDAFVTVNAVRSEESLRFLAPGASITCHVASGGQSPALTIESDRLVPGQTIQYDADLAGSAVRARAGHTARSTAAVTGAAMYLIDGRAVTGSKGPRAAGTYVRQGQARGDKEPTSESVKESVW